MTETIAYDPSLLDKLRARLKAEGLNGFLVPHADRHQSEYLPPADERLARLTGFTGSAGFCVVLEDEAAVFVDGRYTLQAATQVDETRFTIVALAETRPSVWLASKVGAGQKIGFDPWLHSLRDLETFSRTCRDIGAELIPVDINPIDADWSDQPAPPATPVEVLDVRYAGLSAAAKRERIGKDLRAKGVDAAVLGAGDSIAWLFNIRAADVPYTPLVLSFAIVRPDGRAHLFVDPSRIDDAVRAHLGPDVTIAPPDALDAELDNLGQARARVLIDPASCAARISQRLEKSGAQVVAGDDPCQLPKACKTPAEITGMRRAHVRDGVALTKFLAWLSDAAPKGGVTEMSAAARLDGLRAENELFRGLSFPTISGSGPNGAIVHYKVSPESDRALKRGELFLVDSGGQYLDGTTDVTRTVAIGRPSVEMQNRFTRVLKGHIAISSQVFPKGTQGAELDVLARRALWEAGLDYDHGTGHGVGTYLGVHEGPQRISKRGQGAELMVGMVLSNEPGYYKAGAYGIRIENLITVVPTPTPKGGEREMLAFDPLTLAPIDRALIETALLTDSERAWVDAYHARVLAELGGHISGTALEWLQGATAPLDIL